jgi:hypothetical protein
LEHPGQISAGAVTIEPKVTSQNPSGTIKNQEADTFPRNDAVTTQATKPATPIAAILV